MITTREAVQEALDQIERADETGVNGNHEAARNGYLRAIAYGLVANVLVQGQQSETQPQGGSDAGQ